MSRSSFRTLDDDGKPVRIFGASTFDSWRTTADPRIKELLRRITFVLSERRFRLNEPEALLTATPALLMFAALFLHRYIPTVPTWVMICVAAIPAIPAVRLGMRLSIARRSQHLTRLMLEEGLCPCCGYNFFGLNLSVDRIPCPECGATWRTDRITRTLPISENARESVISKIIHQPGEITTKGIDDSRGARVPVVSPRLRSALRRPRDPAHRAALVAARRDLRHVGHSLRLVVSIGFITLGVALGLLLSMLPLGPAPLSHLVFIGPAFFAALGLGVYFGDFAYSPRRVRETMLAHRLCASCGGPLQHLQSGDADGCVTCETCHAAWRLTSASTPPTAPANEKGPASE